MALRRMLAVVAIVIAANVGLLLPASPAAAHAALQSTNPADGASLAKAPAEVTLRFTEALDPASVVLGVTGADGASVVDGKPRVDGARVTQPLRRGLGAGHYAVTYRVVSADGHRINGASHFAVTASAPSPAQNGSAGGTSHGAHQDQGGAPQQQGTADKASRLGPGTVALAVVGAAGLAQVGVGLMWWRRRHGTFTGPGSPLRRASHRRQNPVTGTATRWAVTPTTFAGTGLLVALVALVAGLRYGGGANREILPGLPDPGIATVWLLPTARLAMTVAAVTTVGLLLAAAMLSPTRGPVATHRRDAAGRRALSETGRSRTRAAGWVAAGWFVATLVTLWLTLADIVGQRPAEVLSVTAIAEFAIDTTIGRALTAVAALAAVLVAACQRVRGLPGAVAALAVAVVAALPPVFTGHTATGRYPQMATSGLLMHVAPALLWAGGLLALALSAKAPLGRLAIAVDRFSPLAAGCFAAVGLSGLLSAWVHLPDLASLIDTSYGQLILVKAAVLAAIGAVGWWHRQMSMPALRRGSRGGFARLAAVEVVLFGAVFGTAMALSRTPPPSPMAAAEHAGHAMPTDHPLLGYPMPSAPTPRSLLAWWLPEPVFVCAAAGAAGLYLAGVWRLRRRGEPWPAGRAIGWLLGCAVIVVATSGGLARYAPVLSSAHVARYLLIGVLAPLLLVSASPISLVRRTFAWPSDPEWPGPREWVDAAVGSRPVRLLTRPLIVLVVFAGGLPLVYFGGLYEATLRSPAAHLAVLGSALTVGYVFFAVVLGTGRRPDRMTHQRGLVLLLASMTAHALVGVALMRSGTPLAADWFADLARPWSPTPLDDQRRAGTTVLVLGVLPLLVVGVNLVIRAARGQSVPDPRRAAALPPQSSHHRAPGGPDGPRTRPRPVSAGHRSVEPGPARAGVVTARW